MRAAPIRRGTGLRRAEAGGGARDAGSPWLSGTLLLVLGLTAIGLALRLPSFTDALIGDEVSSYGVVSGHGPRGILDLVHSNQENTPPLYYLAAWATQWIGPPAEAMRLPSLLAGLAAIPLTYLVGLWTVGRRAALVGAALVSLSPFLIFYSTEARAYSLMVALALASTLCLLRALDTRRLPWWAAYAAFSCGAMYAHYPAGFVLAAQLGWALAFHPGARPALLAANLAAAVAYLPWLGGFFEDRRSPTYLLETLHPFTLRGAGEDVLDWSLGQPLASNASLYGDPGAWMMAAGVALGAAGVGLALRRRGGVTWPPPRTVLVLILAAAAPVGAAVVSVLGETVFIPRNLVASWPGLALAAGALLAAGTGWLRVAAVTLTLGGFAIGSAKALDADYRRADYESAAAFIEADGPPGSPVVEMAQPTPGPQTALEAALGPPHEARPGGHRVFSAGLPDVASRHRDLHLGIWPYLTPPLPMEEVARRAARLAAGGTIYFVSESVVFGPEGSVPGEPPGEFTRVIGRRFRHVETRGFPGSPWPVRVYVFRDRTGGEGS